MSISKILDGHIEIALTYGTNGAVIGFASPGYFNIKSIRLVNPVDWPLSVGVNNLILDIINIGVDSNKSLLVSHFTNWSEDYFSQAMKSMIPIDLPIFSSIMGKGEILEFTVVSEGSGTAPILHTLVLLEVANL